MTQTSLDNVKHMSGTVHRTAASNHCLFFATWLTTELQRLSSNLQIWVVVGRINHL